MIGNPIRSACLRLRSLRRKHRIYHHLSLPDTFCRIYSTNNWGDDGQRFYSRSGSRGPAAERYCASVIEFIREHRVPHGPDVRALYGSGVNLKKPPFWMPVAQLWSFPLKKNSLLRTVLFRQAGPGITYAVA